MSMFVIGFCPADAEWDRYKKVWIACKEARIRIPAEVEEFFGGECPDDMPGRKINIKEAVTEYNADGYDGLEVEIAKLPPHVKVIRFVNSY